MKCVRKRGRRNSKIYRNLSQLLKIRLTRTDWSKLSVFGHSKVKLKWDRHLLAMSFTLSLLSNLLLCKIVVCSLFCYYHSLRKPVGLWCILLSQPPPFFRRDKKPIKKKPTKKKGELPDKPTKVTTSRLLTKITNLNVHDAVFCIFLLLIQLVFSK